MIASAGRPAAGGDPLSAAAAAPTVGMIIPPSVRIEGCTPPSESSLDGEEQLYKCERVATSCNYTFIEYTQYFLCGTPSNF